MVTERANFKQGQVIEGQYRITGAISWGTYALVYDAERLDDGREVALKVLRTTATEADPSAVERFVREAEVVARLRHPNIVAVWGYGKTADDIWYLAMERLHGKALDEVMYRVPVPPAHVQEILRQILQALSMAHAKGLIHRDLKPPNIFLCEPEDDAPEDQEYLVKLLDFGFMKGLWGDESVTGQLTNDTAQVGTPGYLAPEMLTGQGQMSPQVDLYAAGLIGWEMLAGEEAFKGKGMKRLYAQLTTTPEPTHREILDYPVFPIIDKLIAREPADRYRSADDAIRDLDALEEPPPIP